MNNSIWILLDFIVRFWRYNFFFKVKDNGYEVTHDGKCITVFR